MVSQKTMCLLVAVAVSILILECQVSESAKVSSGKPGNNTDVKPAQNRTTALAANKNTGINLRFRRAPRGGGGGIGKAIGQGVASGTAGVGASLLGGALLGGGGR